MERIGIRIGTLVAAGFVAALLVASSFPGSAQRVRTEQASGVQTLCSEWIDSLSGRRIETGPQGWLPSGNPGTNPDPNHVIFGGHTAVRQPSGMWIDQTTGQPVPTGPPGYKFGGGTTFGGQGLNPDPNHVMYGGHTFLQIEAPCPAQPQASSAAAPGTAAAAAARYLYRFELRDQWVDLNTRKLVPVGPPGFKLSGASTYGGRVTNPDPDHVDGPGYTFIKEKNMWVNGATEQPVQVGPEGWSPSGVSLSPDVQELSLDRLLVNGDTLVRVLGGGCGEPMVSLQAVQGFYNNVGPNSNLLVAPAPTYGWGGREFSVGGYLGAIGRTDTYDDDYKVGGTSMLIGGSLNLTVPLTSKIFIGGGLDIMYPFQSAELEDTKTKLGVTGIFQGNVGTNFHIGDHPARLWGEFGGAIGAVQSGYDAPTYGYNDTEPLKGRTLGVGASVPVCPHGRITTSFSYTNFPSSNFDDLTGTYKMSDSGFRGTVGYQFTFGGHKW